MSCSYSVIIPTRNAEKTIGKLLDVVNRQNPVPAAVFVIDSQSEDRTAEIAREKRAKVTVIAKETFDHGGTRDWALRQTDTPYVIFLTQDALPADDNCMARLLAPMEANPNIAIVGGRQQPYPEAKPAEKLVRAYNYPAASRIWGEEQREGLGVRAYLVSDVFAAYRRTAYEAVGGFDSPILTNEDMLITQKFLDAGYLAAYAADAVVLHSHDLTLRQQYQRTYIVGRTMVRYEDRFQNAQELGEGVSLAITVMKQLLKNRAFGECFRFAADCGARFFGNRKGRADESREKKRQRL